MELMAAFFFKTFLAYGSLFRSPMADLTGAFPPGTPATCPGSQGPAARRQRVTAPALLSRPGEAHPPGLGGLGYGSHSNHGTRHATPAAI